MKKKLLAILMTGIVAAVSLAGCGGSSAGSSSSSSSSPSSSSSSAETAAAGSESDEADVEELISSSGVITTTNETALPVQPTGWTELDATEELTIHSGGVFYSLAPLENSSNNEGSVMFFSLISDTLFKYDEEGAIVPWLATGYEFSDDNSYVTITLRDDVYFTNGDLMTAEDVAFSINEILTNSEYITDFSSDKYREYVDNVEVVDDFTVKFNMIKVKPNLLYCLQYPDTIIISKSAYEALGHDAFWESPVTTGAYVVQEWDAANCKATVTLREDDKGYWAYDAFNTYTNIKTINFAYSSEQQTRVSSLQAGEVQIIDNVPTSSVEPLIGAGYNVYAAPANQQIYLLISCAEDKIFSNPQLTEALNLCIDRDIIVDSLLDGYGIPASWPCLSGQLGYEDKEGYSYDPVRAAELVAESGYNGEEINFIFSSSGITEGNELSQAIQSYMQAVGFNVTITTLENALYDEVRAKGDYDLALSNISSDGNMWFKIAGEVVANDRFSTGYTSEELFGLGEQIKSTMIPDEQDEILQDMYEYLTTAYSPIASLYYPQLLTATRGDIDGIVYHSVHYAYCSMLVVE